MNYGRRPNGSGSVTKLSGNRRRPWMARTRLYHPDGTSYMKVIGCYETKTDAQKALLSPETVLRSNITFEALYTEWAKQHYRTVSDASARGYMAAYKRLGALYGKRVGDIRPALLQGVINGLADNGAAHATMELTKALLVLLFKYAEENEVASKNYAKFIKVPQTESKRREVFTDAEIETYREEDSETSRVLLMLIYSGMRIGELLAIRTEDVHLSEGYVIGGEKTDAGRNRVIPIHNSVMPYWIDYVNRAHDEKLFHVQAQTYRKELNALQVRLGLPQRTPHSARHTFATMLAREGVEPLIIQKVLGHTNYTVTAKTYTHLNVNKLLTEVNRI